MYFKKPDRLTAIYDRSSFYNNKADWGLISLKLLWGPLWMWRHTPYHLKYTVGFVLLFGVAPLAYLLHRIVPDDWTRFVGWLSLLASCFGIWMVLRNDLERTSAEIEMAARRSNLVYLSWLFEQGVSASTSAGSKALTKALTVGYEISAEIIHALLHRGAVLDPSFDAIWRFTGGSNDYLKRYPEELEAVREGGKREGPHLVFRDVWIHLLSSQKKDVLSPLLRHINEREPLLSTYVALLQKTTAPDSDGPNGPSNGGTNSSGLPPGSDGPRGGISAEEERLSKLAHENPEMDFQEFVKKAALDRIRKAA